MTNISYGHDMINLVKPADTSSDVDGMKEEATNGMLLNLKPHNQPTNQSINVKFHKYPTCCIAGLHAV